MGILLPALALLLLVNPLCGNLIRLSLATQESTRPAGNVTQNGAQEQNAIKNEAAYSRVMSQATDLYVDGKFDLAARQYEAATKLQPSSEQAMYWAGQALVYGRHPSDAIFYLESAHKLGADSIALHLALTAAYAGASREADLDKQRELLRLWRSDGHHPGLAQRKTFLVETFYTHEWHVNVGEYFEPADNDGFVWKFTVRDPSELVEKSFVLQRVDSHDATSAHVEKYVLSVHATADGSSSGAVIHTWNAMPEYLAVRSEIMKKLRFQIASH